MALTRPYRPGMPVVSPVAVSVGPRPGLTVFFTAIVSGKTRGWMVFGRIGSFGAVPQSADAVPVLGAGLLRVRCSTDQRAVKGEEQPRRMRDCSSVSLGALCYP